MSVERKDDRWPMGPQRRGQRQKSGLGEHAPKGWRARHYAVSAHRVERKNRNFLVYLQQLIGARVAALFAGGGEGSFLGYSGRISQRRGAGYYRGPASAGPRFSSDRLVPGSSAVEVADVDGQRSAERAPFVGFTLSGRPGRLQRSASSVVADDDNYRRIRPARFGRQRQHPAVAANPIVPIVRSDHPAAAIDKTRRHGIA